MTSGHLKKTIRIDVDFDLRAGERRLLVVVTDCEKRGLMLDASAFEADGDCHAATAKILTPL